MSSILNSGLKPTVEKKELTPFHITWVTHNSRTSERMVKYKVKKAEPIVLSDEDEIEITSYIGQIVKELNLIVLAYNICRDHIHIILFCEKTKLSEAIKILKSKSTYLYKKNHVINDVFNLWARKYNCSYLENNEKKLINAINYVNNNREKHSLPTNNGLKTIIKEMLFELKNIII